MRKVTLTLKKETDPEKAKTQEGLYLHTYLMREVWLKPGESVTLPVCDLVVGYYSDWSDQDIIDYYDKLYGKYGLVTTVEGTDPYAPPGGV